MIVVTGATGHLGHLAVESLLEKVPADRIVAAVRTPEKAADLAARGVQVRRADYTDPASLAEAFAGAEKLLLVSSSEVGQRVPQHAAVIEAAKAAGVRHLVYTSVLFADTSKLLLAAEHKATEELIRASGIPFTLLRNSWYTENYEQAAGQALATGSFTGAAGEGRVGGVPRADYAEAVAVVLTTDGHDGKVYELAGDQAWTYDEFAATLGRLTGKAITYQDVPVEQYQQILVQAAGLPEQFAAVLADGDRGIADGELVSDSGHLRALLGRPTTPLDEAVAALLKK